MLADYWIFFSLFNPNHHQPPTHTHTHTFSSNPSEVACVKLLLPGLQGLISWLGVLDSDLYQWDWMDEWSPVGLAPSFEP